MLCVELQLYCSYGCTPGHHNEAACDAAVTGLQFPAVSPDTEEPYCAAVMLQAKQQAAAAKRSKQGAAREEATLATAEQLKQKKIDTTFAVDPLFHKMSALFDEGGAKGGVMHRFISSISCSNKFSLQSCDLCACILASATLLFHIGRLAA